MYQFSYHDRGSPMKATFIEKPVRNKVKVTIDQHDAVVDCLSFTLSYRTFHRSADFNPFAVIF